MTSVDESVQAVLFGKRAARHGIILITVKTQPITRTTMRNLILIIPFLILIFCSCQKEMSYTSNKRTSSQVDVYVAGADSVFENGGSYSTYGIATYWKNGVAVNYTDGTYSYTGIASDATAIVVSGTDVYMAGYARFCGSMSCGVYGMFWKNGVSETLDLPAYPTSLAISNNDIYLG